MLSVSEARAKVLAAVQPLPAVNVLIGDALGRVIARDLTAPHDLPRFDNSAMDGYAVVAADTEGATEASPVTLKLAGEVRAGFPGGSSVVAGTVVRIMTGAPVPEGADAIVPVEVTDEVDGLVQIARPAAAGDHVRLAGGDLRSGAVVVSAGSRIGSGEIAVLASLGLSPVEVHSTPTVAILVTGDELVAPEESPAPGQIRDSNSLALRALVTEAGGSARVHRNVADGLEETVAALRDAAQGADLVISSGGVSMGRYDYVKEAVERVGHIDMWRVAMQPGKPVVLGDIGGTVFIGLPGNPVSIHVGFEQFVRPALLRLQGMTRTLRPTISARLTEPLEKRAGRMHFVRVTIERDGDDWSATPTGSQGSHIQSSLVGCHGVARFEVDETHLAAGDQVVVEVWELPGEESM